VRIGIDLHVLGRRRTGTETYLESLVQHLARLDAPHEYRLFTMETELARAGIVSHPRFQTVRVSRVPLALQRFVLLPRLAARNRLDLLHVQRVVPLGLGRAGVRSVVTIHDIAQRAVPECFGWRDRCLLEPLLRLSARLADRIIVDTAFTRGELRRYYGVPEAKIPLASIRSPPRRSRPRGPGWRAPGGSGAPLSWRWPPWSGARTSRTCCAPMRRWRDG
jgi:glycosyltransferase involved in cell wall biosynthesis